jgi:hypothetical protein
MLACLTYSFFSFSVNIILPNPKHFFLFYVATARLLVVVIKEKGEIDLIVGCFVV